MKKIIILGLLIFSNYINTQAQCWDPQVPNTITTDWRASNTSNTWDWTQERFYDMYVTGKTNPVNPAPFSPFWSPLGGTGTNSLLTHFTQYPMTRVELGRILLIHSTILIPETTGT